MEYFWNSINKISPLTETGMEIFKSMTHSKIFSRGQILLEPGSLCRHIYYTEKGLLRNYYIKEGKDITEWITLENDFCFSINSFFKRCPSKLGIECLEDSEIVFISRDKLLKMCDENLEIAKFFRQFLTDALIFSQVRMESIQFETALQRYKKLIYLNPEILKKVSLKHIASFLGVTLETLSRIRAKID